MIEFLLEKIFLPPLRYNRFWFAFLLGIVYSLFGLTLAVSTNVGLLAVFVIAIAIQPFLSRFFSMLQLEQTRAHAREASMMELFDQELAPAPKTETALLRDYGPLFSQYTAFFLGIFSTFVLFALAADPARVYALFDLPATLPSSSPAPWTTLAGQFLWHNAGVLFASFLLSLVLEFGASLVTVWNAVFWGLLVTVRMREAVQASADPSAGYLVLFTILPHLVLEAMAYISAMFAGGMLSTVLVQTHPGNLEDPRTWRRPLELLGLGIGLLILAAVLEALVFSWIL